MASCWLATASIKKKGREVGLERSKRGEGLKKERSNEEGHFLGPFGLTKERELTVILGKRDECREICKKKKTKERKEGFETKLSLEEGSFWCPRCGLPHLGI